MGLAKTENFSATENKLAAYAKALAHPGRVAIMEFLAKQNTCVVGSIVEHVPLSQSTISQHLSELKKAGLIQGTVEWPRVNYCVNKAAWMEARDMMINFFSAVGDAGPSKNCC